MIGTIAAILTTGSFFPQASKSLKQKIQKVFLY